MSELTVRMSVQDWRYAHAVAHVALERSGTSVRETFRRLVYHLDAWQCIIPDLEVPPVVGGRSNLSVLVSPAEKVMYCKLAGLAGLSQSDLGRALIFYHWKLRQGLYRSYPNGELAQQGTLSFAPDRQQPWYGWGIELAEQLGFVPGRGSQYIIEWVREHGVSDDDVKELEWRLREADNITETYRWSAPYISPARLAKLEAENMGRRKYGIQALGDYWHRSIEVPWFQVAFIVLALAASVALFYFSFAR